jgi:hypothetical protein
MGMFDWITIDDSLLPKVPCLEERGIVDPFIGMNFQTKDLENSLLNYKIEKDLLLQREEVEKVFDENPIEETELGKRWNPPFLEREISRKWIKDDFTGIVNIYNMFIDPETEDNIWVDFKLIFYNGEMKKITLDNWRVDLAIEKNKRMEEWGRVWKKREKDHLYKLCSFISLRIINRLISTLNKFDDWIRSYQPK